MSGRASLREQGETMRRRLFGDDDGAPALMRTLNTEASYGAIWSRPGLGLDDAASEEAVEAASAVFAARSVAMPKETAREDSLEALSARGRELMQQLHGERATQGYAAPGNAVTGALYPLAIQYGYGEIWFRPGLDLRRRALVAVAAFTALKLDGQVKKFGQSALNMGLSRTEVIEAVIQTAPLSGFAPALNALGGLSEALGGS